MAGMMGAMAYAEAARIQQQRRPLQTGGSRMINDHESSKARVRVYKFGEHLKQGHAGNGVLSTIPNSAETDIDLIKGMLLRAAYGDSVDFEMLDISMVYLYLLPDGEEVTMSDLLSTNDKIVLFVSAYPFEGSLLDPVAVFTSLADSGTGPPLTGQAFDEQESQRKYARNAMQQLQSPGSAVAVPNGHSAASGQLSPDGFTGLDETPKGTHEGARLGVSSPPPPLTLPKIKKQGDGTASAASAAAAAGRRGSSAGVPTAGTAARTHVSAGTPTDTAKSSASVAVAAMQGGGRRLSMSGNQKLRRVVHKLVLINRFNKSAQVSAANSTKASMSASSASGGVLSSSGRFRSRWGRRSIIGKTLDTYIKESNNIYGYVEQRRLAESDEKLPWYILRPDVTSRIVWDFIILGLVMYFSVTVPIKLGFDQPTTASERVFDYLSDCVFLVDIVLNFMTTFNEDGVWVNDRNRVALNYATGWFSLDVLASFPVGWFTDNIQNDASGSTGVNKILRMLRMFKLFRMLRMLKLFPKLFAVLETSIKIDPAVLRFLRSFLLLLMMWHLIGCAYWFVSLDVYGGLGVCPNSPTKPCFVNLCLCDPTSNDPALRVILPTTDTTWYDPFYEDHWLPTAASAHMPFGVQYGEAIMWAVAATTSIGDNIIPRDEEESGFSVFVILIGLMMYSLIIGAAGSALANLDSAASAKRQVLDKVVAYMRSRKVPIFFQKIIMDYYNHVWSSPGSQDGMMDDLPPMLRSRLQVIMNRDIIERFPIMQMMTMEAYLRLVSRLSTATYLPGEYIYRQGDIGDEIYFIKRGKVDAVLPNGVTVFQTLKPGAFFGEHAMLYLTKRDSSTRAVDFVDVYTLHRNDFTELYISAPEFVRELQRLDEMREKERLKNEVAFLKQGQASRAKAKDESDKDITIAVKKISEDGSKIVTHSASKGGKTFGKPASLAENLSLAFAGFTSMLAAPKVGLSSDRATSPALSASRLAEGSVTASSNGVSSPSSSAPVSANPSGGRRSSTDKVPHHSALRKTRQPGNKMGRRHSGPAGSQDTAPSSRQTTDQTQTLNTSSGLHIVPPVSARAPAVKMHLGEDGFEMLDDFDLFKQPTPDAKKSAGPAPLMSRISEGVRTLMPGAARKAELEAAKAASKAETAKNPYTFKTEPEANASSDDDEGGSEHVISVVAEVPHTPKLDVAEPLGRVLLGKERRASLRRPPTAELLRMSVDPDAASVSLFGAFKNVDRQSAQQALPEGENGGPALPGFVGSVHAAPVQAIDGKGPSSVQAATASAGKQAAATSIGLQRLPSGPLDMSDGQLDALLEQVGGLQ